MFDHMLKKNGLKGKFRHFRLERKQITFIKELIEGVEVGKKIRSSIGREKGFLYDIVANKRNGIDVDKWDYFARDSLYLGISNQFDWRRYIKFARVLGYGREKQICIRDKEIEDVYEMFHTRFTLHRRAYQHKVTQILEAMIVEALEEANDHLKIPGKKISGEGEEEKREMLTMSQSIQDMEAYSKLTDYVMWQILSSTEKNLKKSRDLVERILKRDIYVCIGQTQLEVSPMSPTTQQPSQNIEENDVPKAIYSKFKKRRKLGKRPLEESDIIVRTANFSYGMGKEDPVKKVKFYKKDKPNEAVDIHKITQNSMALPGRFSEKILRVFVKKTGPEMDEIYPLLEEAFNEWCKSKKKSLATSKSTSETKTSPVPAV